MTFRARPVAKRRRRAGWDSDERRTALINGGFILAIVAAVVILVGYAGWTWYSDHFGAAATVGSTTITRDDLRTRVAVERFRIKYTQQRIQDLLTAGRVSQSDAAAQLQYLDQRLGVIDSLSLERLIDASVQSKLATDEGITVADADVDAQMQKEATLNEQRHVWLIEVEPAVDTATGQVGETQKAEAKQAADTALTDLKAGKPWEEVAKSVSTATSAPQAGDLGWLPKESGYDAGFMDAVFAASLNTPTDVIVADDGTARIGRVTEVAPETVDQAFTVKLEDAGVSQADYRTAVRADVVEQKLSDKVVADLSKPGPQRQVLQIFLPEPDTQPPPEAVKVRHILFSPKDDPQGAADLAADDPAWQAAKDEASKAYQELLVDPSKFDVDARTKSDDGTAAEVGGKLPYYDQTSSIDAAFGEAIFTAGLRPGQILEPVKSAFGWHVIQFLHRYGDGGDEGWLQDLKTRAEAGIDFAQLARDNGEGPEAREGGDIGWVIHGQLDETKEAAIFGTKVGGISDVLSVPGEGTYLFKVLAEESRAPDADQIKAFKDSGFTNWYAAKKAEVDITRNLPSGSSV